MRRLMLLVLLVLALPLIAAPDTLWVGRSRIEDGRGGLILLLFTEQPRWELVPIGRGDSALALTGQGLGEPDTINGWTASQVTSFADSAGGPELLRVVLADSLPLTPLRYSHQLVAGVIRPTATISDSLARVDSVWADGL